ncbi:MAG TPA: AraC family transcriptional regulator [Syntrophomonadaceae bacterium]|nr:AraC family transcriptional regulator [Syntrophomonadaceae bacterium]
MKDISEKISYLQGLCVGLNIGESSAQGKIIHGLLSVMEDMESELRQFKNELRDVGDCLQNMDDDLFELQESQNQDDDEEGFVEVSCPKCGEELYFDAEILDDEDVIEIICPSCNEVVFINDGSFDFEPSYIDEEEDNIQNPSPS